MSTVQDGEKTTPIKSPHFVKLSAARVTAAKSAYTTRRIDRRKMSGLLTDNAAPCAGDLLLARVEKVSQHKRIELTHGRKAPLFTGDEIIVCYGNRYAPDQFEAETPGDLQACHLVAAGGVASKCVSRHSLIKPATQITPLGLICDERGRVLNIADGRLPETKVDASVPLIFVIVGTAMNAGKTTTAAHLIRGLAKAGIKVGAAKLTGTGAGGDRWLMEDAGAHSVYDFTDAGYVSTYKLSDTQLDSLADMLIRQLQADGAEAIVLELADGLLQSETEYLLCSKALRDRIDGVLFAAGDAMGAHNGIDWLRERRLPVVAMSGCLSASPLAAREAEQAAGLPVIGIEALADASVLERLFKLVDLCRAGKIRQVAQ